MAEQEIDTREQIAVAIKNHLVAQGIMDPATEMVFDWGIVIHLEKIENEGYADYIKLFANPDTPPHVALGLFTIGCNDVHNARRQK